MEKSNNIEQAKVELKEFLDLPNVKQINTLAELDENFANLDELQNTLMMSGDVNFEMFRAKKNTIVLFDCEDLNSAFLHEWALKYIKNLQENDESKVNFSLDNFNILYIKSDKKIKDYIKVFHKWNHIPVENFDVKKYEIFVMIFINQAGTAEFYWKSDDFDVINDNVVKVGIDLVSDWEENTIFDKN